MLCRASRLACFSRSDEWHLQALNRVRKCVSPGALRVAQLLQVPGIKCHSSIRPTANKRGIDRADSPRRRPLQDNLGARSWAGPGAKYVDRPHLRFAVSGSFSEIEGFCRKAVTVTCIAKVTSRGLKSGHADAATHRDVIDPKLGPDPPPPTNARGPHDIPWRLSLEGVRPSGSSGMAEEINPMLWLPLR